jgi:hypothetical protein
MAPGERHAGKLRHALGCICEHGWSEAAPVCSVMIIAEGEHPAQYPRASVCKCAIQLAVPGAARNIRNGCGWSAGSRHAYRNACAGCGLVATRALGITGGYIGKCLSAIWPVPHATVEYLGTAGHASSQNLRWLCHVSCKIAWNVLKA